MEKKTQHNLNNGDSKGSTATSPRQHSTSHLHNSKAEVFLANLSGETCLHFKNTIPPHLSKGANTAAVHLESGYCAENSQHPLAQCRWRKTMEMMGKGEGGVNELRFSFMATPRHDNTCVGHKSQSWMTSSCNYCCIRAQRGGTACSLPLEDCSHR